MHSESIQTYAFVAVKPVVLDTSMDVAAAVAFAASHVCAVG